MVNHLNITLIHFNVQYGELSTNVQHLIELNRSAAQTGHQIIVNTEMALSGYSFESQEVLRPFACSPESELIKELEGIAREHKTYICLGAATRTDDHQILHNSAIILGPEGRPVLTYHKINAEARWACPGDPRQTNIFNTPWGNVGVLICSDTYHGLLVRQTALKGADLVLVPANWPPSGLDPMELWAIRARENGIYIAACNRTGKDLKMDCESGISGIFSPEGKVLTTGSDKTSKIISGRLPLYKGKLDPKRRKRTLAKRRPIDYGPVYLDMRYSGFGGSDLTSWHKLNPPEPLEVISFAGLSGEPDGSAGIPSQDVLARVNEQVADGTELFTLMIFPMIVSPIPEKFISGIKKIIANSRVCVCFSCQSPQNGMTIVMVTPDQQVIQHCDGLKGEGPGPDGVTIVDQGPARLGICLPEALLHPETGISHAKLGCDMVISSCGLLDEGDRMIFASRCLDKTGVAIAANNSALICQPPQGHNRWKELVTQSSVPAKMIIDPSVIREKIFQDRVDFKTLLKLS